MAHTDATQVDKQTQAAADAQHALASRDKALLDAAVSQRVAEAHALRFGPCAHHIWCNIEHQQAAHGACDIRTCHSGSRSTLCLLAPHRSAAEADAKASGARLKQALAEVGRWKAAAENERSAVQEQASRQAAEVTRLHQGEDTFERVNPAVTASIGLPPLVCPVRGLWLTADRSPTCRQGAAAAAERGAAGRVQEAAAAHRGPETAEDTPGVREGSRELGAAVREDTVAGLGGPRQKSDLQLVLARRGRDLVNVHVYAAEDSPCACRWHC